MKLWSRTTPLRPLTSSALMRPSNSHAKTIAPVAPRSPAGAGGGPYGNRCRPQRLRYVCSCCVTPARNASSTLREASLTSHTARSLFLFSIVCSHCWCCPASYAEPCQQGGSSTRTHYLCIYVLCIFLFTHSSIFRERVVRNDSLIQRLGRQRSGAV